MMARTKTDPLADAKAAVARLDTEADRWRTAIDDAKAARETAEASAGRRLVDGEATEDDIAAELASADAKASAAERALLEVERRRVEARRDVLVAAAVEVERRAEPVERQLLEHRAAVEEALDVLQALDEWTYVPATVEQHVGRLRGEPVSVGGVPSFGKVRASKTSQLEVRLRPYRTVAEQLRSRAAGDLSSDEAWAAAEQFVAVQLAKLEA